ncbi:MAG: hypothetical protein V1758_09455, partial [Pseudomonadota bacterium]
KVCFDHAGNCWKGKGGLLLFTHSYEGYPFPDEKSRVLELIDEGLAVQKGAPGNEDFRTMLEGRR